MTDNGPVYRSCQFLNACAALLVSRDLRTKP
jgi:hypothetical protein